MAQLRIGTCSWKFPSWQGLVYSATKGINHLAEYARQFDTVEVDQWFWSLFGPDDIRLPRRADAEEYRKAVPDGFRFTVKVANSITLTHLYHLGRSSPLVPNAHFLSPPLFAAFVEQLGPLHGMLGPLMFQFEYLNRQKMASQAEFQRLFTDFLAQIPTSFPYALETRNGNYLNKAYFEFLARNRLIPVLLQGYWMPPVAQVYAEWHEWIGQSPTVVIRLHGPSRQEIEEQTGKRWDQIVAPQDDVLAATVSMVEDLLHRGADVYVNVNNHFEGSAPLTIRRLRGLLRTPQTQA